MTEQSVVSVSVVVPMYNEEEAVTALVERTAEVMNANGAPWELVLVDDGSRDRTVERARALMPAHPQLRVIRFLNNRGQTAAMAHGFQSAVGDVVVSMDGDLQNDPIDIPRLVEKINSGYDVVCGWRKNRQDKLWTRKVPSKVANWLIAQLTGIPIHDNGCSLKAFRRELIQSVNLYAEQHRFIPARAGMLGARIAEVVVTHHARTMGASKYGLSRIWKVFLDLFVIKMLTGFSARPVAWFTLLSVPFLVLAGLALAGAFASSWAGGGLPFVPLTCGLLLLFAGFNMVVVGMMGEYIMHARKGPGSLKVPVTENFR